ncbi:MAG: hypothetical protein ABS87_13360 [Sphingomonas sp. SCN 67-18]|nr:MAG: hypothetical protein ABS87_13360 [Sphingomonas sp. SCN 67-18]
MPHYQVNDIHDFRYRPDVLPGFVNIIARAAGELVRCRRDVWGRADLIALRHALMDDVMTANNQDR